MLKFFRTKQRTRLGIDITSTSVKILEISLSDEQYLVGAYGGIALPENVMEGSTIKDIDAVASAIRELFFREGFTCKEAVLAVPDSSAITRVLQVHEGLDEDEIEEIVVMEADKYVPYSIDEINLDFDVLGPSSKNSAMLDVLLVASKSENVNNRVEALIRAGLEVKVVDIESYAVERVAQLLVPELPDGGLNKIVAFIDVGAVYTHFFVLHDLKMIFSHEEEFGGQQLVDAIKQKYGMKTKEAVVAVEQGVLPDGNKSEVFQSFQESILLQVKRGLQFFFSTGQQTFVDAIFLAGGVAKYPNIAQLLQENINIPTKIANPFAVMSLAKTVSREKITNDAPALLVACGLALRAS